MRQQIDLGKRVLSPSPRTRGEGRGEGLRALRLLLLIAFTCTPLAADTFGFRGDGTGRFPDATPPTAWSSDKNVRWSTVVGKSYSSPILTDKLVILTSEPNLIVAVDRTTGAVQWKTIIKAADLPDEKTRAAAAEYEPPKAGSGFAAATPVTDGKLIYTVFSNGIVCAVDLQGKRLWSVYIDAMQNTGYGRSASPILFAGKLIVHMTNLYAFDPATGKQLWINEDAKSTYGTPIGTRINDADVIVTAAGDVVRAADGKILGSEIGKSDHASPVAADGILHFFDSNVSAVRLGPDFKEKEIWSDTVSDDVFSSPLIHNQIAFLITGKGAFYAYDTKGKALTEARPLFPEPDAAAQAGPVSYGSITLAGKYLFIPSRQGDMVVLEATAEAKVVARNKLPAGSGGTPIFSGKSMFIRDGDRLFCIGA